MPTKTMTREAFNAIPTEKKTPQGSFKYKAKSGVWVVVEEGHQKAYNVEIGEPETDTTVSTDPRVRALEQQVAELRAMVATRPAQKGA